MILDFHCHILPGLDHGCRDLDVALQQLRTARKRGIDWIAATSHFYPDQLEVTDFLARRQAAWELLQSHLPVDAPHLLLGAEVLACEGLQNMPELDRLMLPSGALLLEMPLGGNWSSRLVKTVEALYDRLGFKLVLAHVDRYPTADVEPLLESGIRGQLNGYAVTALAGRRRLLHWAEEGYIAALGSDTHGNGRQFSCLEKAVHILGKRYAAIEAESRLLMSCDTGQTITV